MSIYQRIILIIGSIGFVIVLLTAPQINFGPEGRIYKAKHGGRFADIIDINTASVRGLAVLGATLLLWFAAKGINPRGK
jgi:hypothetical protein